MSAPLPDRCSLADPASFWDEELAAHKFSPDGSIFAPESLREIRDRLGRIESTGCVCADTPHLNALHDLAHDDVPVLLQLLDAAAVPQAENERLRAQVRDVQAEKDNFWQDFRELGSVVAHLTAEMAIAAQENGRLSDDVVPTLQDENAELKHELEAVTLERDAALLEVHRLTDRVHGLEEWAREPLVVRESGVPGVR